MCSLLFFLEMIQISLGVVGCLDSLLHDLSLIPALALCLFSGARTRMFFPEKYSFTPTSCPFLIVCNYQESLAGSTALQLSVLEMSHKILPHHEIIFSAKPEEKLSKNAPSYCFQSGYRFLEVLLALGHT